jgi:hypothetical protein
MTDRELLEASAKAAELPVSFSEHVNGFWPCGYDEYGDVISWWNPLTDDADALRLMVKLKLVVECDGDKGVVVHDNITGSFSHAWERFDSDPYAATRRAIVRAAAEIGRAMP